MLLDGRFLYLPIRVFAHVVDKACKVVFLANAAEFLVELVHDDMHAHVVIWTRTGFVMATIVEIIRAGMSAVPGRNHIVAAYRAFDKLAE